MTHIDFGRIGTVVWIKNNKYGNRQNLFKQQQDLNSTWK